jgi:ribosomal 50S subunit-recycling heat shock protein
VRLDLFLKVSRLCSGRSVAQKFCEAGRVFVNGRVAKSAHDIKPGDEIQMRRHNRITTVRVVQVPATKQVARKDAPSLYELIGEETVAHEEM